MKRFRSIDDLSEVDMADEEKVLIVSQGAVSTEMLYKEMDILQGLIKWMADNSFAIKKWAVACSWSHAGLYLPLTAMLIISAELP